VCGGNSRGQTVAHRLGEGPSIVDDVDIVIRAAVDGVGWLFMDGEHVANQLASGKLVRVLEDWCQPCPSGSGESWFTTGGLRLEPRRGN
jgi:DNA-binding transcriptional LysR family regulator